MIHRMIRLTFELKAEHHLNFPEPDQLAQGVFDGLPKEWYSYQDDDDYKIDNIVGGEVTSSHEEIKLKATIGIRDHQIETLKAELEQERRLTKHLDGVIYDNGTVRDQNRDEIAGLENELHDERAKIGKLELQISGQAGTITGLNRRVSDQKEQLVQFVAYKNGNESLNRVVTQLQTKYDASLNDWKTVKNQRNDAISRADTLKAMNEAQSKMINGVKEAMEGLGYEFQWGNDKDLEELERRAEEIKDAANVINTAAAQLDSSSIDLDAKLDNIRTER